MAADTKIPDGTVDGLLEFGDYLIERGYGTAAAVGPLKSAAKQVFSMVEGEGKEYGSIDVRTLDLDDYLRRFETKSRGKLKAESVAAYRARVTRLIESYRAYVEDSGSWRPPNFRASAKRTNGEKPSKPKATAGPTPTNGNGNGSHTTEQNGSALIDYPFPLRSGQIAHLRLPSRLDKYDAERIANYITTMLVMDPMLEIPEKAGAES